MKSPKLYFVGETPCIKGNEASADWENISCSSHHEVFAKLDRDGYILTIKIPGSLLGNSNLRYR
ncbi:AKR_HP2_G0023550.mRNA.1.CDS.1 [Saccharomyces cerevisiae]|nr:AKR_HP2_G0023550.mRNA.1.CDS.1 [Saccharomyces cerevisiae]CAI6473024.1 AKR_HP2_G0023550.mRNA.1.CDS.1 [Saccharomyces cerevisiae]